MNYHMNFKDPNQTTNLPKSNFTCFPDGHPNVEGNKEIADEILRRMKNENIF